MTGQSLDVERGKRIANAMEQRGRGKAMAFAAEIGVSPTAMSKWMHGYPMTLENACLLAGCLDVSLDWLVMGRNLPAWLQGDQLTRREQQLLEQIQRRPRRVVGPLLALIAEIPERDAAARQEAP